MVCMKINLYNVKYLEICSQHNIIEVQSRAVQLFFGRAGYMYHDLILADKGLIE